MKLITNKNTKTRKKITAYQTAMNSNCVSPKFLQFLEISEEDFLTIAPKGSSVYRTVAAKNHQGLEIKNYVSEDLKENLNISLSTGTNNMPQSYKSHCNLKNNKPKARPIDLVDYINGSGINYSALLKGEIACVDGSLITDCKKRRDISGKKLIYLAQDRLFIYKIEGKCLLGRIILLCFKQK